MSFLAPLALLAGLIAIPIIMLYILRLRRREVPISSTFLWQQILQDSEANTPWQRLRRNLLLLLQLIILALLVLALMRPFVPVPTLIAGRTALLLDATASMNATDMEGGRTRFEAAQEAALEIIADMGPLDVMSIIRVGEVVEPLTPYTNNPAELRDAILRARPSYAPGDWDTALILAAAGATGAENFNIVLVSDGGLGATARLPLDIPQPAYVPIGRSGGNVAITALAPRALPGAPPQVFARVTNYGETAAEISLVLRLDGQLDRSLAASVSARSERSFVFELDGSFSTIEAELVIRNRDAVEDHLQVDNRAWAVAGGGGVRRLLLYSETNIFVEEVLRSLPLVQVFRGDLSRTRLPEQPYDLYVFNGWLPAALPDGDMLIINPPASTELFTLGPENTQTDSISILRPDDPRLTFVTLDRMNLRAFRSISAAPWADVLVRASGGPLLLAGEEGGRRIVLLPFDVRDSDLPLQISWPILMTNLIEWFTPGDVISVPEGLRVGDPLTIRPPLEAELVHIHLPDGDTRELPADRSTLLFAETYQPGLYRLDVLAGGEVVQSQAFAVNLSGTGESDITPVQAGELQLGGDAGLTLERELLSERELWPLAALLALLVLLIEWYAYHQRMRRPTVLGPITRRAARGLR